MPVWLNTTLLGLGTVFVGLICLIFITMLMSKIINARQKPEAPAAKAAPAPQADAIPDRPAFVAAVAAAVATVIGTDVSGLRIHSIQKIN